MRKFFITLKMSKLYASMQGISVVKLFSSHPDRNLLSHVYPWAASIVLRLAILRRFLPDIREFSKAWVEIEGITLGQLVEGVTKG